MNWKNQGDRPEHNTHKPKQRRNQGMESADRKAGGWSKEGTEMGKWPLSNLRTRLPQAEQRTPSKANSLQLIKDATYFCFHFAGLGSTSLWGSGGAHKVDCREEKLLGFFPISQLAYNWIDKEALKQGEEDPGAVEKQRVASSMRKSLQEFPITVILNWDSAKSWDLRNPRLKVKARTR